MPLSFVPERNSQMKLMKMVMSFFLLLCLFACGGEEQEAIPAKEEETPEAPKEKYKVPEFAESVFDKDAAESRNGAYIDLSHTSEGYVAVSATSDQRLKFQVLTEETYNYDLSMDGDVGIFPLQSGDGEYIFRVLKNVSENKYAILFETSASVTLADEFQPYIRSNNYAAYSRDSECVKLASSFSDQSSSAVDVVKMVYDHVCANITYDRDKASDAKAGSLSGYLPDPDETLNSGKGICFDYASLTAAMLRSQGIPVKVIFGYVRQSSGDVYHAWNMFYTKEEGWVTVEFKTNEEDWNRIDLTFSANGADPTFIGDGSNYAQVYQY